MSLKKFAQNSTVLAAIVSSAWAMANNMNTTLGNTYQPSRRPQNVKVDYLPKESVTVQVPISIPVSVQNSIPAPISASVQKRTEENKCLEGKVSSSKPIAVSQKGIDLVKGFENFRAEKYLCPANEWTIAYGHKIKENENLV